MTINLNEYSISMMKYYRPRQIAEQGLITNSTGGNNIDSNYFFVLKLIKSGKLKARNYSTGQKRAFWLVSDVEIQRYLRTINN